jgi:two-component system NtrC family sensor kinase
MQWHRTVSFRVIAGSLALLLLSFALYAYLTIRFYDERMMAQARDGAHRVSDVLESSTRYSMLLNRKADVYQSIRTVAREQPGVEGIRIYNKSGGITFSTDDAERNTLVNLGAEACYGCHARGRPLTVLPIRERSRIYRTRQGYRVLGVITPIRNSPECAAAGCHVSPAQRTILGVLDVRVSLKPVDAVIARATARTLWVTAIAMLAVALAAYAFLDATVRRPIRALREGTRQIAAGNLEHEIAVRSDDDLGDLARSFNAMTQSLRAAQAENRSWAESLEERVRQKSDEIRRMHSQILQVEKMASLGTLAATVAHEINNPLSGILTYARLNAKRIRREGGDGELERKVLQDLDLIVAETQRCGAIVNNLLLFSRKQVGEFHLVSLGDVVERARGIVAHHLAMANVRLTAVCEPPDLAVVGDEGQLQQALVALFVNATEAMPDGGALTVTARREAPAGEVRLSVADTGSGIAPEDLAHVFEPFFTTKRSEGQGVGLGLSVVYGIVERHGAAIAVQSQLGMGTTFTITFPPADRGPSRAAAGAAVTAATSGDAAAGDAAGRAPGPEEPA